MDWALSPWLIWFILGVAMAFLELAMPGFVVLFFGIGCWATAAVVLIWPLTLTQQLLVFLLASHGDHGDERLREDEGVDKRVRAAGLR